MVLQKNNAIADWRALIGPTNALKAKVSHPDSIRAMYWEDLEQNCVHGSDSHESVAREISFFFTETFPESLRKAISPCSWKEMTKGAQKKILDYRKYNLSGK